MRAGQQGSKALAAALKRNENKFLKIRYKYTTHSKLTSTTFWVTLLTDW